MYTLLFVLLLLLLFVVVVFVLFFGGRGAFSIFFRSVNVPCSLIKVD